MIYGSIPENEDLTIRPAAATGIDTSLHGLLCDTSGALHYLIRRFDPKTVNVNFAIEDFAKLSGRNR